MVIQSGNIYFLIIGPMRLSTFLPAAVACLLSLPTLAEAATDKNQTPLGKLTAKLQSCPKPEWPAESLRNGEEGAVVLAYLIGMDGRVIESRVEKSSGHPLLDLAAQDGLAKCLFMSPETIGWHEPTWTKMSYVWTLEGGETPAEAKARLEQTKALAAAGNAEAMYQMSWRYFAGDPEVDKNVPESLRLLRKSAESGYVHAQVALSMVLAAGRAADKDVVQAIDWAKKAADQGNASAQLNLAKILLAAPEEAQDYNLMFDMLERAVDQGDPEAKTTLGMLLIHVQEGDKQRGLQLVVDAAEAQNRAAQYDLAYLYENGEVLQQDMGKARALYERSAAGGYEPAKDALLKLPR
ncbi:TonB family C-terminal domain-containing protein [Duganella sp. CF458]|uniref:TonB family protein n=1 Tax=Duganella sp. CF458 TaxID=1884368 RepID=UPI0008E723ED|nr:TonB family protein [Duganella sp. CF458]SFF69958.1 TonB family C-terminal domain-containing protein [Duganella sp. CF458]